jgi:hypothetical protein
MYAHDPNLVVVVLKPWLDKQFTYKLKKFLTTAFWASISLRDDPRLGEKMLLAKAFSKDLYWAMQ